MRKIMIRMIVAITLILVGTSVALAIEFSGTTARIDKISDQSIADEKVTTFTTSATSTDSAVQKEGIIKEQAEKRTESVSEVTSETVNINLEETMPICEYCGYAHGYHYVDVNGDGVCDYCQESHHGKSGSYYCHSYMDYDGDGICDHYKNREYPRGRGHGYHGEHHR